ncbi:SAM-dependent methyltransferase [Microvirga sp. KLBC 81]|uniref:class I SAM-dependent methyltransferase n=1 Tax=Microvirga sp. KLBC 81 TaxID=1862707 RepID=UPI000D5184FF|nr:class I SAM-dependent methyltransferase [Microvirga sp. KLBC 81]PVE22078.1 SAM-dependent methyltransferase [Microvirga sp. KLBC 81]
MYKHVPKALKNHLRWPYYVASVVSELQGRHPRECSLCGYTGYFRAFGHPPRYDAQCPKCRSLERHRLLKLCLDRNSKILRDSVDALHFAPEPIVEHLLRARVPRYKSADYEPGLAELTLNIEELDLHDNSFDLIICCHVLEHVDDRKALREMFRVLRPNGIALLMTPVIEGWSQTYENPNITSTTDRLLHFGQEDHVRYFGSDIRDRITAAGFELETFVAIEPDVARYGLGRGAKVFIAQRPINEG